MKLPFLCDSIANNAKYLIKSLNLPVNLRIAYSTLPPLWKLLGKHNNPTCGNHCICHGRDLCNKKNVVYEITCSVCLDTYIGETMTTLLTRLKRHINDENSEVQIHLRYKHALTTRYNITHFAQTFNVSIMDSGFHDTTTRKVTETQIIRSIKPSLNIQMMQRLTQQ